MKNLRKHKVLNLPRQKEEEPIWCQNQIIKVFHRVSISNRNETRQIPMNKPVYIGL